MKVYVGCTGWNYSDWESQFYPKGMDPQDYLPFYSKFFTYAEIDSSFQAIPDRFMTIGLNQLTPDNFRFTAKFPRLITHDSRLAGPPSDLETFFEMMKPLKGKLMALLIQLPSSLAAKEGMEKLKKMIPLFDMDFRYAIEVRHESWFNKDFYRLLSLNNICLTWSVLDSIHATSEVTADFIYLRFMGEKRANEKESSQIRNNRAAEMKAWAARLRLVQDRVNLGIIAVNNHYGGFGPASVNEFRKIIGLKAVAWDGKKKNVDPQLSSESN
jgi:uncharacterized protein YecE (DUF72 family)